MSDSALGLGASHADDFFYIEDDPVRVCSVPGCSVILEGGEDDGCCSMCREAGCDE